MMEMKFHNPGKIAGWSIIIMALAAGYSYGFVLQTFQEILTEKSREIMTFKALFVSGLAGWVIVFITDIIVSIALFQYFKNLSKRISFFSSALRLVYTLILGMALYQLFSILPLLKDGNTIHDVTVYYTSFKQIWSAGLIVFGWHLIGLGYLANKSDSLDTFYAYLLYLAGISYVFIHLSKQFMLLSPDTLKIMENALSLPMALGEILMAFKLMFTGFKNKKVAFSKA